MCVLFHLGREIAVDHDFVQLVPTRPDVVHKNLVRGEGIFNGRLCEVGLFQLDSVSQLVHRLNPQVSLKIFTCEVLSNKELVFEENIHSRQFQTALMEHSLAAMYRISNKTLDCSAAATVSRPHCKYANGNGERNWIENSKNFLGLKNLQCITRIPRSITVYIYL